MRHLFKFSFIALVTILTLGFSWYLDTLKPISSPVVMEETFRSTFAGEQVEVLSNSGWWHSTHESADLLVSVANQKINQQEINLCEQSAGTPGTSPIIPVKIGHTWQTVESAVEKRKERGLPAHYELRNLLLDSGVGGIDIPALAITGEPSEGFPENTSSFRIKLNSSARQIVVSDQISRGLVKAKKRAGATQVNFLREAWVIWGGNAKAAQDQRYLGALAIHIQRLSFKFCSLGILRVTLYQADTSQQLESDTRRWPLYQLPLTPKSGGGLKKTSLSSGRYSVPNKIVPKAEDETLFKQAVTTGLIQRRENGRIQIAPKDLIRQQKAEREMLVDGGSGGDWQSIKWSKDVEERLNELHGRLVGRYVRRQVERFNAGRFLASIRWRGSNGPTQRLLESGDIKWSATLSDNTQLSLDEMMPLRASALFNRNQKRWEQWQHIESWPANYQLGEALIYTLQLPKSARGTERFELMVIGSHLAIKGAVVIENKPRCIAKKCSNSNAIAKRLLIDLNKGVNEVTIEFQPKPRDNLALLYKGEFQHITFNDNHLSWQNRQQIKSRRSNRAIQVTDRNGLPLFENGLPTALAKNSSLAPLVGINLGHSNSLAGMLARISKPNESMLAKLTIDLNMQVKAQKALNAGVKKVSESFQAGDPFKNERTSGLVIIDADSGEILAAAGTPTVADAKWQDVAGYDAVFTAKSPLRLPAFQHNADNHSLAGSTFKLVSSLLLEQQAANNPMLENVLAGVTLEKLNHYGNENGYSFLAESGCYPAKAMHSQNCRWGEQIRYRDKHAPVINNYGSGGDDYERPSREMERYHDSVYGLEQALRDSMNTWFAWLFETTDGTLLGKGDIPGLPHSRSLAPGALKGVRPMENIMQQLGLTKSLDLSGGLLPANYPWQTWDVLRSTASYVDPISDRHTLRQMAIGLRTHTTPLNMALVSAAIATEQLVKPKLLAALNGEVANETTTAPLGIHTDRIKLGMKRVPVDGTAKHVFSSQALAGIRDYLFAKTGTAPVRIQKPGGRGFDKLNTAWLTGWLEPGVLPNQPKRLAFACMVNHTQATGGKVCGSIVAALLLTLKTERPEQQTLEKNLVRELSL